MKLVEMLGVLQAPFTRPSMEKQELDAASDDEASQKDGLLTGFPRSRVSKRRHLWKAVVGLAVCLLLGSYAAAFAIGLKMRPSLDRQCIEHTSAYCTINGLLS